MLPFLTLLGAGCVCPQSKDKSKCLAVMLGCYAWLLYKFQGGYNVKYSVLETI